MSLEVLTKWGCTGESASVFVAGLSEADVVTASNGVIVKNGVWKEKVKPIVYNGYTRIDYIESTGTQYIDTGFTPNQNSAIIANVSLPSVENNEAFLYGAAQSSTTNAFECYAWNASFTFNYGNQANRINNLGTAIANQKVCIAQNKNACSVQYDGGEVVSQTTTTTSFTAPNSLTLSALHRASDVLCAPLRIYDCKLYDNGALVRDFIPVKRNSDGVIGLYDFVNSKFYANAGTGEFIAGDESKMDGHIIESIKAYGVWTVTATNGVHMHEQSVSVNAASEFEIDMSYTA